MARNEQAAIAGVEQYARAAHVALTLIDAMIWTERGGSPEYLIERIRAIVRDTQKGAPRQYATLDVVSGINGMAKKNGRG